MNKIGQFGGNFGIQGWDNRNPRRSFSPELRQRQEAILGACLRVSSELKGWTIFFNEYSGQMDYGCPGIGPFSTKAAREELERAKKPMRELIALCNELASVIDSM